ncbi:MAG: hypothetical protein M1429_01590 [Patescibacteria group bacterium]|nr:hypothetical protein [Patescibacteria group bacterium]
MKEIKKKFHPVQIVILILLVVFGIFAGNILPRLKNAKAATCNLPADGNGCDNQDAVIDGGTVMISGSHSFSSLRIKNNGVLTHDTFISSDNPTTSSKKVDLVVSGSITLETGGSINVDGKGYLGGDPGKDGSGPSAGKGGEFNWMGSGAAKGGEGGGGSFRGYGGDATDSAGSVYIKGVGGPTLYSQTNPLQVGSGGGGARYSFWGSPQLSSNGGAGGGRINIDAGSIYFNSTSSKISANGQDGASQSSPPYNAYAGAGSGGSVKLVVHSEIKYLRASLAAANVNKGIGGSGSSDGELIGTGYFNISAAGGNAHSAISESAGGGGGGYVSISGPAPSYNDCIIGAGLNSIPASCENQDVVIEGTTVYADNVLIGGDAKRTFNNLTIRAGGVLTHQAVTVTDMASVGQSGSLATSSPKKVDLVITNGLSLEGGGKIDVSGMGYPGGLGNRINNGCGRQVTTADTYATTRGYGPGGGSPIYNCDTSGDHAVGGGGGYGGNGGNGRTNSGLLVPGGSKYPTPYLANLSPQEFEFGSGGGGAAHHNAGYSAHSPGAAGGGRIKIETNTISFSDSSSYIVANGAASIEMKDLNASRAYGGNGAGGTIWITVRQINQAQIFPSVTGFYGGEVGTMNFPSGTYSSSTKINLAAISGLPVWTEWSTDGGGGGGRMIIQSPSSPPPPVCNNNGVCDITSGETNANCPNDCPLSPGASQAIVVKVEWPEGLRIEKIELKTFLKN